MPSVIGLLEDGERVAARRVEVLREETDRVLAELREAELDWEQFVVLPETVVEVLAGPGGAPEAATLVPGILSRRRRRRRSISGFWACWGAAHDTPSKLNPPASTAYNRASRCAFVVFSNFELHQWPCCPRTS
ncbi:hypothetical protein [Streptomyces sp. NBC_01092]|uniref:hypothetical protein n=1 Tax=Streptomyces sp. NBC_01092 TaxID=2903748 RepID=UPI0038685C8E|nr:hypothetical protein OG254_40430 [Streptomyces sp. NBC_01092]